MNPPAATVAPRPSARRRWLWVSAAGLLLFCAAAAFGLGSQHRFRAEAKSLRDGLANAGGVEWRQRIALKVGGLTLWAVRAGLSFAHLDPRARAALRSLRSVQVDVYQLPPGAKLPDRGVMLDAADQAAARVGWSRVLGALHRGNLVAVYVRDPNAVTGRLECLVVACDGDRLAVVAAQGNPQPLVQCWLEQRGARTKWPRPAWR